MHGTATDEALEDCRSLHRLAFVSSLSSRFYPNPSGGVLCGQQRHREVPALRRDAVQTLRKNTSHNYPSTWSSRSTT